MPITMFVLIAFITILIVDKEVGRGENREYLILILIISLLGLYWLEWLWR